MQTDASYRRHEGKFFYEFVHITNIALFNGGEGYSFSNIPRRSRGVLRSSTPNPHCIMLLCTDPVLMYMGTHLLSAIGIFRRTKINMGSCTICVVCVLFCIPLCC